MNYQKVILVGNATDDAKRMTSKSDVAYATFSVGVSDGKDRTTFFPVVVFGKYGEAIPEYITKGRQVLVEGQIRVNGEGRFRVFADRVRFGSEPKTAKNSK